MSEPPSMRERGGRDGICPELTLPTIWSDRNMQDVRELEGVSELAQVREDETSPVILTKRI